MNIQPGISGNSLRFNTNTESISGSDEDDIDKSTREVRAGDQSLTKSQLRRLRRGRKSKRSGRKRPKIGFGQHVAGVYETLILYNLPPFWTVEHVESLLERTTGLNEQNAHFYIEVHMPPGKYSSEAWIQFLDTANLKLISETIRTRIPLELDIQVTNQPGYRISEDFLQRFKSKFNILDTPTDKEPAMIDTTGTMQGATGAMKPTWHTVQDYEPPAQNTSNNERSDNITEIEKRLRELFSDDNWQESVPPLALNILGPDNSGNSDDSTETVILKQEPIDFDESATATPEPVVNNELRIKEEPRDEMNILPKPLVVKQERKDLDSRQVADDRITAVLDEVLKNFNPNDIELKPEIADNQDNNQMKKNTAGNNANSNTATSEKQSSSTVVQVSNKSVGNRDVSERRLISIGPCLRNEICESIESADQTVVDKDISNDSPKSCDNNTQINTDSADDISSSEKESTNSPINPSNSEDSSGLDESDENNCKIVHIKNLPQTSTGSVNNLLKRELSKRMHKNVNDDIEKLDMIILIDEMEHKLLGEALINFKTHEEAVRACEVLNGVNVVDKPIEVKLDIGHKSLNEHIKSVVYKYPLKRRGEKPKTGLNCGEPAAKRPKGKKDQTMENIYNQIYLPPLQVNNDNYGLSTSFLNKLGLRPPLPHTINVRHLHHLVDEDKLYEVFSLAGDIKRITFRKEAKHARIEYDHPVEAVQAIQMFKQQKLFGKKFSIQVARVHDPRPLPVGLSGVNRGLDRNGEPLRAVRAKIDLRPVHEALYELGKMRKFEDNYDINAPFSCWYGNITEQVFHKKQKACVPPIISSPINNVSNETNRNNQPSDLNVIEELGAILKARGLIPTNTDCRDGKNILTALQSSDPNASYSIANSNAKNNPVPNTASKAKRSKAKGKATQGNVTPAMQNQMLNDPNPAAKGKDSEPTEGTS